MDKSMIAEEALRRFPGARKVAVRNFVGTLIGCGREGELANLLMDAKTYSWDTQTIDAIAFGINTYYQSLN
jgi:hypothetical protein